MSEQPVSASDLERLRAFDTPTICNGLELVAPERRLTGFTAAHMICAHPKLKPIVGFARTATIRAVTPPSLSGAELREQRLAYYARVAAEPRPSVVVIQDLDPQPGLGAFWGEVNSHVHRGLGCLGVVTNGSIRDLDAVAEGFQLLAGRLSPSHAHVHVVDVGTPVNVFGMAVNENDIVHADQHGAVVVPAGAIDELLRAIDLIARREAVLIEASKREGFGVDALRAAMQGAADIH